jgi:ribosomal protein L7Ae-like RNA K-turn-binding protein
MLLSKNSIKKVIRRGINLLIRHLEKENILLVVISLTIDRLIRFFDEDFGS